MIQNSGRHPAARKTVVGAILLILSAGIGSWERPDLSTGVADTDGDGIADIDDNCTQTANPDQRDTDADGYGNHCDGDLNNDCAINFLDLLIMEGVFFDTDLHADLTGDGFVNFLDLQIMERSFFNMPGPSALVNCSTPVAQNMFLAANPDITTPMDELYWDPESYPQVYPATPDTLPFTRIPAPACEDGTTPASRTCATGEPIRCTDGTRPMYYYRPSSSGSDRWIVHIQNGGVMCQVDYGSNYVSQLTLNCWTAYRYLGAEQAFSSIDLPATDTFEGIFLPDPANLFDDYNMVVLDKCVGDRNLGAATVEVYQYRNTTADPPVVEAVGPVYFHGQRIVRAVLKSLHDDTSTAPMGQVLLQAHSNGSMGLYLYVDALAEYLRGLDAGIDVRGLAGVILHPSLEVEATADALGKTDYTRYYDNVGNFSSLGFHIETGDTSSADGMWASAQVYQPGRLEQRRYENWGSLSADPLLGGETIHDGSCLAAHAADPAPCYDYHHVLTNHLATPVFLTPRLFDANVRTSTKTHNFTSDFGLGACDAGDACCHDENYAAPADCVTFPDQPTFFANAATYEPLAFGERVNTLARAIREMLPVASEMAPGCSGTPCDPSPLPVPPHGFFVDDTASHDGMKDPFVMDAVIDGRELQEYLQDWVENDVEVYCLDVSGNADRESGTGAAWGVCP